MDGQLGFRVEGVKQDSGDSKKGDIVIHIPTKTAERLHEYLAVSGLEQAQVVWKSSRGKRHNTSSLLRRPPPDLTDECSEAIEQLSRVTLDAATDGALQQLIPVNADNPINPENNPDGARVPDVVVAGNLIFTRLYRQRFGRGVPNRNALRQFMAAAGTVITTVMSFALDLTEEVVGEEIIRMENERLKKAESENLQCKGEFVCLEDECQGYSKTGQSIPLIGRKFPYREHERLQLGYCRAGASYGCPCEVLLEPHVYSIEGDDYLDELAKWIEEGEDEAPEASCDSNNRLELDPERFKESVGNACHNHDKLKRLNHAS